MANQASSTGVKSIAKAGSAKIIGDATLTGGTNVTLTQSGQDISIASTGGAAGATTALDNLASVAINATLIPGTSDAVALGSTTKQWSDLFLAEGGVINWDNGDATLTQAGNVVTLAGADFTADNVTANTALLPDVNDGAALGQSGTAFSDLFLATGGVINWNTGDVTITQTGTNSLAVSSPGATTFSLGTAGTLTTGPIELGHATDTTLSRSAAGKLAVEGVDVLLNGGALGTPSSGTLTNATGLPVAGITSSTSTALGVGSLEIGHASDTTLTRASAGVAAIEGSNILVSGGALGTPASGTATNLTGTAAGLTAGTVTTNANLTGNVTSSGNVTTIANAVVTNAMLATGTGDPGGAWNAWSPTVSGRMNDAKWDKAGKYIQVGKTVHAYCQLTANAATPADGGTAEFIIALPVTALTLGSQYAPVMGTAQIVDGGVVFAATVVWNTTTTCVVRSWLSSGAIVQPSTMSSTSPFTWASTDQVYVNLTYPAA